MVVYDYFRHMLHNLFYIHVFCLIKLIGTLSGKNVVITGGSAGIGEQIAYHYARMGARILITSRTEANLKRVTLFFLQL